MLTLSCFSLLSMGCSFIFVRPPPSQPEPLKYFDCVSNAAAPATDITNAVFDGLLVASALDQHEPEFAAGVSVAGAVYAASAIYGFIVTSNCASAKERLAARVDEIGRNQIIQRAELRVERDTLQKARAQVRSEAGGCGRDLDCKGDRLCVNAMCVSPPAAPAATPPTAVPPTAVPPTAVPSSAVPSSAVPPLSGSTLFGPRAAPPRAAPAPAAPPGAAPPPARPSPTPWRCPAQLGRSGRGGRRSVPISGRVRHLGRAAALHDEGLACRRSTPAAYAP